MAQHSPVVHASPERLTPASVWELASGVDALYLSGWATLPDDLLARLESAKGRARAADGPVGVRFGGIEFGMSPGGLHKYAYRLSHAHGELAITPSAKLPPLRWQPRSAYLHGVGVEASLDAIRTVVMREVEQVRFGVSRVDLFADWQGWDIGLADERRFVKRARHVSAALERDAWTGFTFGRRSTGGIGGRVYDKTAEIAGGKGNPMWLELWKERYLPGVPVIRVEFEFHRRTLKAQFRLDTPEQVLSAMGGLWGHATEKWLTHRDPAGDATRSRWAISPEWLAVQQPSFRQQAVGLERALGGNAKAKLENILPVLRGCFTSASAQWGVDGMVEGLDKFGDYLHSWELATGHSIDGEIARKRQLMAWGL